MIQVVRELARAVSWHRRLLAAGLVAAAVAAGLSALSPTAPRSERVLAVARDLPSGYLLRAGDVATVALPPAAVPAGALRAATAVVGRIVAAPMRRGEPITDVRLLGPALLSASGDRELVAVPVHVLDAAAAALLHAGDVVDVLAAGDPGTAAADGPVAGRLRVLSVRLPAGESADGGALVVVAADESRAAALAAAAGSRLTVVVRGRA